MRNKEHNSGILNIMVVLTKRLDRSRLFGPDKWYFIKIYIM